MPRVLVIDDTRTMRLILKTWLKARPAYEIAEAATGAEALGSAQASPPQLLVVDWHLPDTDGGALAARIRALPGLARVPALFLSTEVAEAECRAAAVAGPGGYLLKPLNQESFLSAVDQLLALVL